MDRILLNQKTVNVRKILKKTQKDSVRGYCRGRSISKTKIGKLFYLVPSRTIENKDKIKYFSSEVNLDRMLELLEYYALTGMSGNGFSVKTKLELLIQHQSQKYLLINGVECEPGLLHDEWILNNYWEEVSKGIQMISKVIPFERCVLAHKIHKAEKRKKRIAIGFEECGIAAMYPMGEEHLLIKQVFGKTLSSDAHPVDEGILVMNVQTVYQIYNLLTNQYQNGRYITLADLESGVARVEYVKRGENIKEKLTNCFPGVRVEKCFAGSGIMSAHIIEENESFSDGISFAAIGESANISNNAACKGCGMCNRKCPAGVNIRAIVKRREIDNQADLSDLGIENCMHCGSCTFFCRAGKDITEYLAK